MIRKDDAQVRLAYGGVTKGGINLLVEDIAVEGACNVLAVFRTPFPLEVPSA